MSRGDQDILIFRYLKMATDIFWSRPGPAAAVAAASCTCCRGLLAQTNVSNAFRVNKRKGAATTAMGPGDAWSGQPSQVQCLAQRSSAHTALGWASVEDPNESRPFKFLKKRRPPVSPVLMSVEGLVHCHPLAMKGFEGLGLAWPRW